MRFTASWDHCNVPIRIDDGALKDRVERFLGIALTPEASGERPTTEVRRSKRGWEFATPFGSRLIEGEDDAAFLLLEVLAREIETRFRRPVAHAGAFVVDNGAILYLAGLRQGKSRLTFAAWRRGYPVLGDDRIALFVEERAVKSLPKCLKLRLEDDDVPPDWRASVPEDGVFVGTVRGDRRWILSRRLPGVVSCAEVFPVRAVVALNRMASGSTHLDEAPATEVLKEALPAATVGENTPIDVLRFLKPHAPGGRIPRLNLAPDEFEEGVTLLAGL